MQPRCMKTVTLSSGRRLGLLVLVEGLCVSLEGEPGEYPVVAVRRADTLYLTTEAYSGHPPLVSDHIF